MAAGRRWRSAEAAATTEEAAATAAAATIPVEFRCSTCTADTKRPGVTCLGVSGFRPAGSAGRQSAGTTAAEAVGTGRTNRRAACFFVSRAASAASDDEA
jgi:hypothetical protein